MTARETTAAFACDPALSRGRVHDEPDSSTRSLYQRDRDRVVHSTAFRRLKDKTQVFVYHEGDHYRTRLTHSLEVAQIARSMARNLGLNEDLTEALALAHDLGHTPFGHAGERALERCLRAHGGFDHNIQTFRIVTRLESRYGAFDGLNLTLETLEGIVKHNGPLARGDEAAIFGDVAELDRDHGLWLDRFAPAEAQVAAIADDIAYDAHDIDDGLRAGLFDADALMAVPVVSDALEQVIAQYGEIERQRLSHETVRRMISAMIADVLAYAGARTARLESVGDVRDLGEPLVAFSPEMALYDRDIKRFLDTNMYKDARVLARARRAEAVVTDLFEAYSADPAQLPEPWRRGLTQAGERAKLRRIADFIAGMSDRFAVEQHRRLFDLNPFA